MRFAEHRQLLERLALGFPIQEIRRSGNVLIVTLFWITLPNGHETLGLFERQRSKQHGVDDAEDGGIGPDTQCECEHGYGGEAGVLKQLAKGEFEIIHNVRPPLDQPWPRDGRENNTLETPPQPAAK